MRAAVLEAQGQPLVVQDIDVEEPQAGEVAVRVTQCGICHSDLSLIDGQLPASCPIVLGHEAAGVVSAVGPAVTSLAEGDHVVLTPCPPCGHCYFCVRGEWSICTNSLALMTSTHPDGGTRLRRGDDVVGAAQQLTLGGVGVDYAFDAVGRNSLVETGINATRFGGTTVMVGVAPFDEPLHFPSAALFAATSKKLLGCLLGGANSLREIPRLVTLWQRDHLDLEALITGHRPLTEINQAVDDLRAARGVRTVISM